MNPAAPSRPPRSHLAALAAIAALFLALAWPGAGSRGVVAEEIQPYLERYHYVLELGPDRRPRPLPPFEPGAPSRPRWVSTFQWPVVAYDGESRVWPVFIRGHQTALGNYFGILLGPLLGGGIAGMQRSSVLLSLPLVLLAYVIARRSSSFQKGASAVTLLAPALVALSFGILFFARTGYAFESASRVAMLGAITLAASRAPLSRGRAVAIGLVAALAVLCRATIAVTLAPVLLALFARPERRGAWRRAALVPALMAAVPLLVVALLSQLAPFRPGTEPLADFRVGRILSHLTEIPACLLVQIAWLGDALSILGPLRTGAPLPLSITKGVLLGLAPLVIALVRLRRGTAGDGERMLLAGLLGNAVLGALLYGDPMQFQLAMALEPLLAVAVAEQIASVSLRRIVPLVALALVWRAQSMVIGLWQDTRVSNPMFSGHAQRAVVTKLESLGAKGPDLVTTTYNQAGVIEAWTNGAIAPVHAWPVLMLNRIVQDRTTAERLGDVLSQYRPRWVLLTEGNNLYEGSFADNEEIAAALRTAAEKQGARIDAQWSFPTESGAPGYRLVSLAYPRE
ncbi:hypothetical protein [Polyangium sp. 15x6]|uniref:hypothetical protein n=1 Tax=Polyangium sp. 15x6 TaxID=3042687 RepID=UPI002499E9A7|nr:hypothetical protein [Polyangium sp. 15x6]MDI3289057.1 hypothetical protein [Polyangium sp. 15x6]